MSYLKVKNDPKAVNDQ
jgi:hypothetical protein